MNDVIELSSNPADAVYATIDDFESSAYATAEPPVDELPFEIPRD